MKVKFFQTPLNQYFTSLVMCSEFLFNFLGDKMQKILEKVTIILVAIFLLVLSQLPMYYVNYENNKNNIYGVANKISVNFIIIALLVVIIAIFLGKKRGFYKQTAKILELRNIVLIFALAILAPILEESIFRVSIYQLFENTKISFAVSSLLFAFVHSGYSWFF